MVFDFLIGRRNRNIEEKAKAFSFEKIYFVKIIENEEDFFELKKSRNKNNNFNDFYDACLIKTDNLDKLRRFIDKASNYFDKVLVLGTSNLVNRCVLEHKKTFALLNPEYNREKDYDNYRNSGLNQVLCKIARENGKFIFISIDELKNPISLGRVIQNFRLCKKFKTRIHLVNFCNNVNEMKSAFELKEVERVLLAREHFEHGKMNNYNTS
jgi:RNase P/RNase MRP subunit p30